MTAAPVMSHGDPDLYPDQCRCRECARAWFAREDERERAAECEVCGETFVRKARGRHPLTCGAPECIAAKNRAYYEEHKDRSPLVRDCTECKVTFEQERRRGHPYSRCPKCR